MIKSSLFQFDLKYEFLLMTNPNAIIFKIISKVYAIKKNSSKLSFYSSSTAIRTIELNRIIQSVKNSKSGELIIILLMNWIALLIFFFNHNKI